MPFNPDEYPALKAAGKVSITKPVPPKVSIAVDRDELVVQENSNQYIDSLNAEIFQLQTQINNRLLLIADIQAAH